MRSAFNQPQFFRLASSGKDIFRFCDQSMAILVGNGFLYSLNDESNRTPREAD